MVKLLSTTAIVLALASPAWAQTSVDDTTTMTMDQSNYPFLGEMGNSAWDSDRLIGMPVETVDGEEIGDVSDIIFTQDDRIAGVVVDAGGFLGVGSRDVALDWNSVSVQPEEERIFVNVTRDQLEDAPQYESTGMWRAEKEAELPDVAESQPGVIAGEDVDAEADRPTAGAGSSD